MSARIPESNNSAGAAHGSGAGGPSGAAHSGGGAFNAAHGGGPGAPFDAIRASAPVFAALGDKTRLDLVVRLCAVGPLSIARLTDGAEVTRQAITKHLNILAGAGLVRDIRVGRERLWEVETRQLEAARRCLQNISNQWDDALARPKLAVEGEEH